jgi:hypothetical protein
VAAADDRRYAAEVPNVSYHGPLDFIQAEAQAAFIDCSGFSAREAYLGPSTDFVEFQASI